ncbi:hypothetical protein BH09ACT13_BH09ACT13_01680 [soil metagenome]
MDEPAPLEHVQLSCDHAADIEEVVRDVCEENGAGAAFECSEAGQALSAADVEQSLAFREAGVLEDRVTPPRQPLETATAFVRRPPGRFSASHSAQQSFPS